MTRQPLFDDAEEEPFLAGRKKRAGDDADVDITPMIDVTFLLLIFFMVSSTMQAAPEIDVPPARFGTSVPTEAATIITVKAALSEDRTPTIYLGDGVGREGNLGDGVDGVRQYVEAGVQKNLKEVIIKADREVPYGFVQEIARTVLSVEGARFSIGVRDRKE